MTLRTIMAESAVNGNVQHFVRHDGVADSVELSIVVPALNEEVTVGEFVDWCHEGVRQAGVSAQILIVDSSNDLTRDIAIQHGAEVLCTPRRGLGRAYIDAIPFIRGKWVVMGDADLTYDFRDLKPFVRKFEEGSEFIMGSRFRGTIAPGAMPALHRYVGTPLTTWLLNLIYGTRFSDIHCGMRGITRDALERMHLRSQSWQYASEMIIKAQHLRLRCAEVPVRFHKDRKGRVSHLKRLGWWAPWHAAWISIEAMLTYGADFFLFGPGLVLVVPAVAGLLLLYNGPVQIGKIGLSLHWMLLFLVIALVGLQAVLMGILAKVLYDPEQQDVERWRRYFAFNRVVVVVAVLVAAGVYSTAGLLIEYVRLDYQLPASISILSYRAVAGLGFIFAAFIYFSFSLVLNALAERMTPSGEL